MDFLSKIEKNHGQSLLALTVSQVDSSDVFLFKFDRGLALKFGDLIGADHEVVKRAYCLDLTSPKVARSYSNLDPGNLNLPGVFAGCWGEPVDYDDERRARLFALASRGLSLSMGLVVPPMKNMDGALADSFQSVCDALAVSARSSTPLGSRPGAFRNSSWDHVEPGFSFESLEWLGAVAEAAKIGSVAHEAGAAPKRSARI